MKFSSFFLLVAFITSFNRICFVESLLFSQYTLLQVVVAVSWPIPYKNPLRKLFFNVGFQFNYGEPFRASSFYNATYFSLEDTKRSAAEIDRNDETTEHEVGNTTETISTGKESNKIRREISNSKEPLMGKDLTAGQLYDAIEINLIEMGYDRDCLSKSICELARHPFHFEHDEEHLLAEVIHFLLTPSEHQGFTEDENYQRCKYETAELLGLAGDNCDTIYSECEVSLLQQISTLVKL